MRVGMVLLGKPYPPDIRVEKEARMLAGAGHEVFLLASARGDAPRRERVGVIEVVRYSPHPSRLRSRISAIVNLLTWRSPYLESVIEDYARECEVDMLHVHDLPGVKSAVGAGRRLGLPVVFDMHENYPAAIGFWSRSALSRFFQPRWRYRFYERWALKNADAIVTVVDESSARLHALGVDPGKVTVFSNVDDEDAGTWDGPREPFTVTFAGGFAPHRGLDTLVRALPRLRELVPGARLVLMGSGPGESQLRELAVALGVSDAVEFTGWVALDEMRDRMAASSVGVVPHVKSEHTDTTIPHKLFQSMAAGLPVVVTDCVPLARVVRETGAGRVARSGDPADLARALAELADPEAARAASRAGKAAVASTYNVAIEGRRLVALYDRLGRG